MVQKCDGEAVAMAAMATQRIIITDVKNRIAILKCN